MIDNRKKICIVTTISGSIRSFFLEQIEFLSKNGYEVTVVCNTDNDLSEILGEDVEYVPITMKRGIDPINMIIAVKRMIKLFKNNKYDIVQYSTPNASLYASIASRICGIKVRLYHNMGFRYSASSGIKRSILKGLEKITCLLSTEVQPVSFSNLKFGIEEKLFDDKKARVIWNGSTGGVDLTKFDISNKEKWKSEILAKHNIKGNTFIFGFVGRITKDKGIDEILLAYRKLIKKHKNSILVLVGDEENTSSLNKDLYEWAKKAKEIIFIGRSNEVYKFFALFDTLLLPSYREGFGNVVIEAQAMGVPVIVSNIPGPTDAMKNNITGLVVESKSVDDLQKSMEFIYENRDICSEMGMNAYKYVKENFDSKELVKHILNDKNRLLSV